jgi:hypothetical protein
VWDVRVGRVHDLQALAVVSVGVASLGELQVEVDRWKPPIDGWLGDAGIPGLAGLSLEPRGSGVRVRLVTSEPAYAAVLLAAVVRLLRPVPRDIGPELTFAPGLPATAAPLAGGLRDLLLPDEKRDAHVRRCDVLVCSEAPPDGTPERARTVVVDEAGWVVDGHPVHVSVDPSVHRPIGRRSTGPWTIATATSNGESVHLVAGDARVSVTGSLAPAQVSALRAVGAVVGEVPAVLARQLNACGVLTVADAAALPDPGDDLRWQAASVHERRHALRQHGPTAALDAWPAVSIVLVTHRADHLEHAMLQLAHLRYPRLEVVVGAHGPRVDPALVWQLVQDLPFPATVVAVDGAATLGEALQACRDRAEGSLITKMDDDDHYGPEHIWDLVLAREYSGAQVVGKALDWIHVESADVTVFRPVYGAEKYAGFVAGGTMLISRGDLVEVGGWRPVPKSVDRALLDRVLADGGLVYRTHGLGYVYVRRGEGHTASVRDEHFLTKTVRTVPGLLQHPEFGTEASGTEASGTEEQS